MDEMTVEVEQLEKILEKSVAFGAEEVSFSFIIGSLFPEAYENIKQLLVEARIAGYNEAKAEIKGEYFNENSRVN